MADQNPTTNHESEAGEDLTPAQIKAIADGALGGLGTPTSDDDDAASIARRIMGGGL